MRLFFIFVVVLFFTSELFARGAKNRILIDLSYGMSYINPSDINDKILDESTGVVAAVPDATGITFADNFDLFASYSLSYRYAVGLVFDMIYFKKFISDTFETSKILYAEKKASGKYYEFDTSVLTYGLGPTFTYFIYDKGKLSVSATFGLIYYLAFSYVQSTTYGESDTDLDLDGDNLSVISGAGSTYGALLSATGAYYVTNYLAIALGLGYKYVKAPALKDEDGKDIKFTWLNGETEDDSLLNIPVGGFFASLSLHLDFNFGKKHSSSSETNINPNDFASNEEVSISDSEDFVDTSEEVSSDNMVSENDTSNSMDTVGQSQERISNRMSSVGIGELYKLKVNVRKAYNRYRQERDLVCVSRMKRLYNLIERIEMYEWDIMNSSARQYKLSKISSIIESCE